VNATEDRLSAAGRAVAVTVPPDGMPPLRLPAPAAPEAGLRGRGWGRPGRRRPGWLAPPAAGTWQEIHRTPHALWSNPAGTVLIVNVVGRQIDVVGHGRFVKLPGTMPASLSGIAWVFRRQPRAGAAGEISTEAVLAALPGRSS
jgi:hypothetical protein